jgi:hypothetical protein
MMMVCAPLIIGIAGTSPAMTLREVRAAIQSFQ